MNARDSDVLSGQWLHSAGGATGRYLDVPGLIRKYFGLTEDGASVVGIYLWTAKSAADAFYSPEWIQGVTQRWGATPTRTEWIVPVVAESVAGRVVAE